MSYYGSGGGSNNSSSWQSHNQKKQSSSSSSNNSGSSGGSSFKGVSNDTNSSPQFGGSGTPNLTQSLIAQFAQAHNLGGLPAALAGFGTWHSQNRMAGNNVVGQTPPSNNSRSTSNGGGKSDYVHHADTLQSLFASPPPPPPPTSNSSSYNSGGGSQSRIQSSSVSKDPNFSLTGLSRPLTLNAMMSSSSSANSSGSGGSMMRGSSPPPRSSRFEGSTRGSSGGGNSGSSSSSSGGGGGSGHHHSSSSSSSSSRYESSRNNNDDHRDRSSNDRSSYSSSSSSSNSNRYSSSSNNSNNHSNNQQQQQQMSLAPPPPPQPAQTQQQTQNSLAAAVVNAAVANPLGLAPNPLLAQALLSQLAVAQQPSLVSTNSLLTAALSSLAAQQQAAVAPALTLAGLQAQVQAHQQSSQPQQQQQQQQQSLQQQQQSQKRRLSNDRRRGSRSRSPPPPQRRTRSRTRSPPPRRSPPRRSRSPAAQRHTNLSSLDFRLGRNLSVTTTNAPGLSNRIVIRRSPERVPERVAGGPGGKQINIPRRRGDSRDDSSRDNDRHRSSSIKRKGSRSRSRSPRNSGRSVTATTKPSTNSTTTTSAVKRFATGAAPNTNKPGSNTTFNRTATTTAKPTPTPQSKEKEKEKEKESGSTNDSSKSSSTATATTTTTPAATTTTAAAATPQPTAQQQLVSKYGSRIPRYPLDQLAANVARLKGRYPTLYVPSDFSNVRYQWHNALPMNRPLKFASSRCMFHIMSKDAHSIHGPNDAVYESSDADYRWTVKVMLLAMPSANEIQKRCLALAEDSSSKEKHEHPARVVEFLVGNRGKHEPMALGGPWSPSLDGPNPATNTQTLINTAVRTVRSLTGIDLSPCTQWFRILDIQYNRNENYRTVVNRTGTVVNGEDQTTKTSENGNDHESTTTTIQETPLISLNDDRHIENTVIFLPNVWTLMPTSVEYEKIAAAYKDFIDNPPLISASKPNGTATTNVAAKTTVDNNTDINNKPVNPNPNPKPATPKPATNSSKPEETTTSEKSENVAVAPSEGEEKVKTAADDDNNDSKSLKVESEMNGDGEMNGAANGITIDSLVQSVNKPEPTHYSKLDLKKMRVDDLRVELEARDLDTKGYKPQLLQRLREALQAEKDAEEPPGTETTTSTKIKQEEIDPEDVQIINDDMEIEKPEEEDDETAATNEQFNADYYGNGDEDDGDQQLEYDENAGEEGDGGEGGGDDYEVDLACDPNGLIEEADSTSTATAANTTDAAKTTTTTAKPAETKSKVIDLKARPKQTRYEREKIYKLPSTPHIIVHPSATAKSNKFNCHLASLSSLLDYSKDDSKECSFEVFLFAECFNEMLMRDQGFTIFKHLLGLSESLPSASLNNTSTTTTSTTENGNNKRKTSDDTTANTTKKVRTTNEDSNDSESAANKSTTTTISLAKLKPKTVYTDLLLAFTYFDTNRTSHILEHDLEELLLRFGPLNLTRSKLRLLMKKLPTIKDGLINYRALTDKTSSTTPLPVLYRLPPDDDIVHYALSFEAFLKRVQGFSGADQNTVAADSILVEINGTAIDVPNTLKKLEKAQTDLHSLDLKFKSSQDEIDHLKSSNRDTERQKQKLSDELSHVQNKLKYEQKSLKDLEEKYARLKSCMSKIKSSMNRSLDDISDVMKRNHPSEKEKSSSVSRSVERSVEKQIPPSSTTSTSKPTTANSSLNNSQTESTTTKDKEPPTTTTDPVVEKEATKTTNGEVAEEDVTKS